jgi:ribosomal-protein-alanine N-acetyltransferase
VPCGLRLGIYLGIGTDSLVIPGKSDRRDGRLTDGAARGVLDERTQHHAVVVEVATERDLPGILAIDRASFPAPWSAALFLDELRSPASEVLIARVNADAKLVGYVCWSHAADEAEIRTLAVHPKRRRQGIGEQLVRTILHRAYGRRCATVYLEVRESNRAAAALYRSMDFVPVGSRASYYGRGEDAVVMAFQLTQAAPGR